MYAIAYECSLCQLVGDGVHKPLSTFILRAIMRLVAATAMQLVSYFCDDRSIIQTYGIITILMYVNMLCVCEYLSL